MRLKLPGLISEGCVLQQAEATRIWGWCQAGDEVKVLLCGRNTTVRAGEDGRWETLFSNLPYGGPYELEVITSSGEKLTVSEVFVGEVWVASGQSNMALPVDRVKDHYPQELLTVNNPFVRLFTVEERYDFHHPLTDYESGAWEACKPETIPGFSAFSFFFASCLWETRGAPVGIINSSVGGSRIEAWLGYEALSNYPEHLFTVGQYRNEEFVKTYMAELDAEQRRWEEQIEEMERQAGDEEPWSEIVLPGFLDERGIREFCGVCYLRKRFLLPSSMVGKRAHLWLGTMVDSDKTYVNGQLVGETGYQYPPRKYQVPEGLLREGENEIYIRLVCRNGHGRVTSGKEMKLFSETESMDLSGSWQIKTACRCEAAPAEDFIWRKPTGLYNGMLAPCQRYSVRGVIWYQGESNDKTADQYEELLKRLIISWREQWDQERLPFIIVQLPNFLIDLQKEGSGWPEIRQAQGHAGDLPDVAVTVNLDLGEDQDLHPLLKKEAAQRAALAARGLVYGEKVCWKSPVMTALSTEEDTSVPGTKRIRVLFETGDGGELMTADGLKPGEFQVAGEDGRFYPVEGTVTGNQVVLDSPVTEPVSIRYAWSNAPKRGLLYNRSGLPARPFCTAIKPAEFGTRLLNDGWEFAKFPLNITREEVRQQQEMFAPVGLPHDWLIYQGTDLYEDGFGWYRRTLILTEDVGEEVRYVLRFEGIYMDSTVYVNGREAAQWKYGYSTFEVDITPFLNGGVNEILVAVRHQAPNSRWYSGAGIYRDVWLKVQHASHLMADGTYVTVRESGDGEWLLRAETEVFVQKDQTGRASNLAVEYRFNRDSATVPVEGGSGRVQVAFETLVKEPLIWDVAHPELYELQVCLLSDGRVWQTERCRVGFRTISFSPDKGFLLNGRKLKLNGVCEHHDLGCLGAAYNSAAMRRKLKILKRMGVNALRLAHNMPAPDVMELADEMGFLVVSEAFDMWERFKTPYDYARFFPEWYKRDVASWIRRDRNHPSLIMWSIGNEIYDTHVDGRGQELTRLLVFEVRKHDPQANAPVTIGSNYMPWENAQKCADIVKLAGYNYSEKYYEAHHEEHPDWIIYGSETSSTVQSRGVYHFPFHQQVLADEDGQCSALGNSTTSWGAKSPEACILAERDHDFSCGQFLWTGFDYIGEPTPYHTRNSYFGQVDTAGFPKDSYYIYQAAWTDAEERPMVHVFPYWDFNDGQLIDVRVCSNAEKVELFLNGESQGTFEIDHRFGRQLVGHWQIPFRKGTLTARAFDGAGNIVAEETRNSFGEAARIVILKDRDSLRADGRDLVFAEISVVDRCGNPVENASNRVNVKVEGAGRLAGLDNGDSTDEEEYKTDSRRLFNGRLLAVAAADTAPGTLTLRVSGYGLEGASITLPVLDCGQIKGVSPLAYAAVLKAEKERQDEIPVRSIRLSSERGTDLSTECGNVKVTAEILPEGAGDEALYWCAVNEAGILSTLAEVEACGKEADITAVSDGVFKLRCMSRAGTGRIRVISELDFTVRGMGKAWLNPYSFVSAGLYDYSRGTVGNGNEHGVATARDGETVIGFSGVDFGEFGSDEITLPIFALTDEAYPIEIWEGIPGEEGSRIAAEVVYQKPSKWNVYQEETYRLNRLLKGVTGISFVLKQKIHLKGFSFTLLKKAYQKLTAADCSQVYGDSFERNGNAIEHIGNNVTLRYENMDFGEKGLQSIVICGNTPMEKNTIQLRFISDGGELTQLAEFLGDGPEEQRFPLNPVCGCCEVNFVFLPGSNFDFYWFCFQES